MFSQVHYCYIFFSSVYGVTHNNCRRSVLFAAMDQPILSCVVSLHGVDERQYSVFCGPQLLHCK